MTNLNQSLIKDPKSVQQTDNSKLQDNGQSPAAESGTFMVALLFLTMFMLGIVMLYWNDRIYFSLKLDDELARRNKYLASIYYEDLENPDWLKENTHLYSKELYKPQQVHISLGANDSEIYVTWATMAKVEEADLIYCQWKDNECDLSNFVRGQPIETNITETDPVWVEKRRGRTTRVLYGYRAKMSPIKPGQTYMYQVRSRIKDGGYHIRDGKLHDDDPVIYLSKLQTIFPKSLSDYNLPSVRLALYGDLGLENGQSIPRLIEDVQDSKYDLIIHNGDFAYDLNDHHGEVGDEFMRQIEPIASRVPYQTSVGNHEVAQNFSHYNHRFTMVNSGGGPHNGQLNNFYYSFNAGPIHFISFSTEFYYFLEYSGIGPLHSQYEWLKKDLKHASSPDERAKRPWIIVFGHRPMYCSSRDRDDCSKDSNLLRKGLPFVHTYALEKLFYDHGVDVELYSHEHQYERFLPIYDGQVFNGTEKSDDPYYNPRAPVHIISGSAGCKERLDPFKGIPATGSVKQISDYGYTQLTAERCKLRFVQISDDQDGLKTDEFIITKTKQNFPEKSVGQYLQF